MLKLLFLLSLGALCYFIKSPIIIKVRQMNVSGFVIFPFIVLNTSVMLHPLTDTEGLVLHEKVHFAQQRELLIFGAFFLFWIEYGIKYLLYRKLLTPKEIRLRVSFEREALENQRSPEYLTNRKPFAWVKYIL